MAFVTALLIINFAANLLLAGILSPAKAAPIDNVQQPLSATDKSTAPEIAHSASVAGRKLHGKFLHISGMC